jgi:hypothetical protein
MLLKKGSKGEAVKQLQIILGCRPDGDFGPTTERLVKEWQKKHGLVADGIVGDKTWDAMMQDSRANDKVIGSGVVYNPIAKHITRLDNRKVEYLVIHYTAGGSSAGDSETKTRNVFLNRNASADFVVDDDTILQVNPDIKNYYCWAVGDGNGKYGITNKNAVSIEICSNLKKGTTGKVPNHTGWYFTDSAIDNAVKLSKMIMKAYNIPLNKVVRHYDATRKLCPGIIGWNPGVIYDSVTCKPTKEKSNEDKWLDFKKRLS